MAEDRRRGDRRNRNQDHLLSDEQIARLAGVPVRTVRYWRNSGLLPFVKVGRHPRVWLSEFYQLFHKPAEKQAFEPRVKSGKMSKPGTLGGRYE